MALVLHYYTVITATFRYYAVNMHDVGNCNMGKSAAKSRGKCWEILHCFDSGHRDEQHNLMLLSCMLY